MIVGITKDIIGEDCENVKVFKRLVIAPCIILTDEYGCTANLQRLMNVQTLINAQCLHT
jgi:molecular chaperone HtpG